MDCILCCKHVPDTDTDLDTAMESGWIPYAYLYGREVGPICEACSASQTKIGDDGELELIPTLGPDGHGTGCQVCPIDEEIGLPACPVDDSSTVDDLLFAAQCALDDMNSIMPTELVERFGATRILLRNAIEKAAGQVIQ